MRRHQDKQTDDHEILESLIIEVHDFTKSPLPLVAPSCSGCGSTMFQADLHIYAIFHQSVLIGDK
jgi:hypothetical protein